MKWLVVLSVVVLIGIMIFGLNPGGYKFSNEVDWIKDQPGVHFGRYGIAYTDSFFKSIGDDPSKPNGFSIELALKPASFQEKGTNFILALHNGKDRNQLLMWQYHSWIILMNGDDYDHKRRTKRIAVNIASQNPTTRFLTVTTGEEGTKVYLDGRLARRKKDLTLKIPNSGKTRLLIGNSIYGKQSWQGDVYGLAFYGYPLIAQNINLHFERWRKNRDFSFAKNDKPVALYYFDEKTGDRVIDHAEGKHPLEIPARMRIFKRRILSPEWSEFKLNKSMNEDNIMNLLGFIPLGFILAATMLKLGGFFEKHYFLAAVSFCFIVSMIIEFVQAWIPSRISSMLDLILNTLGALIGVIILRSLLVMMADKMDWKAGE